MRILWRVIVVLVVIGAIAGLGYYAYTAGVANGLAQQVTTQGGQTQTQPLMPYPYYWHPFFGFGPGFGFLSCLIPLFLLFLIFGSLRFLFWRGPWGMRRHWHHGGPWGWQDGEERPVPPFFDEWHKRAHGEKPSDTEPKSS